MDYRVSFLLSSIDIYFSLSKLDCKFLNDILVSLGLINSAFLVAVFGITLRYDFIGIAVKSILFITCVGLMFDLNLRDIALLGLAV